MRMRVKPLTTERKIIWLFLLMSIFLILTHSTLGLVSDVGQTGTSLPSITYNWGCMINPLSNLTITNVTRIDSSTNFTNVMIWNTTTNVIANKTLTGDTAFFSPSIDLVVGRTYYVTGGANGLSYTGLYNTTAKTNYTSGDINWTCRFFDTSTPGTLAIEGASGTGNIRYIGYNLGFGINPFSLNNPSESGTTKYLPNNYILVNVTANITNFRNMTINLYNTTGLYASYFTTNTTQYVNFSVAFSNNTYFYNVTGANTTTQNIYSNTYTNYIAIPKLNVSVYNFTGSLVSANVTLNGSSCVGSSCLFNVLNGYPYSIVVDNVSYALEYRNITINTTPTMYYNITLYPTNSLNISLYNVNTGVLITSLVGITITGSYINTSSTLTGNLILYPLEIGELEVRTNTTLFVESRNTIIVTNRSRQSLIIYLSPAGTTNNVTFTFYTPTSVLVDDVYIEQKVLTNTSYVLMMSAYSDITGMVYFSYNPSYSYQYTYSKTGYTTTTFILNPPRQANYDITMAYDTGSITYNKLNITSSYSFNNVTKILTFSYIENDTTINNVSYTISKIINGIPVIICSATSSNTTGNFYCNTTGYNDIVFLQGVINGNRIFYGNYIDIDNTNYLSDVVNSKEASFLLGIILILITIAGATLGVVACGVAGVLGILIGYWIKILTPLTLVVVIVDIIVTIIIIIGLKRR